MPTSETVLNIRLGIPDALLELEIDRYGKTIVDAHEFPEREQVQVRIQNEFGLL